MIEIPIEDTEGEARALNASEQIELDEKTPDTDKHFQALQRLQADFDNYRKRVAREHGQQGDAAMGRFAAALLPFFDDFDRLLLMQSSKDAVSEGIRMMHTQLTGTLEQLGLEKFARVGDEFDPHKHDAVATKPVAAGDHNKIMSVLQNGYIFKNKMIRPAQVEVGHYDELEHVITPDGP